MLKSKGLRIWLAAWAVCVLIANVLPVGCKKHNPQASSVPSGGPPISSSSYKPVCISTLPSVPLAASTDDAVSSSSDFINAFDDSPLLQYFEAGELATIADAAVRNRCFGDNFLILLAIRKAENGGQGFEFGVVKAKGTDLDTQAGEAAVSIIKNRRRFGVSTGENCDFIDFMAGRYVPPSVDPVGHENWKRNVKFWFEKLSADSADYADF